MEILIPKPIRKYDCVGIVSASGPVDQQLLLDGLRNVHYLGFDSLTGEHVLRKKAYLAGNDSFRSSDLNKALANPDVHAIIFSRGGYGVMRILDEIDLDAIRTRPKIMVGMSDLTALSLSLFKRVGLVTFAGPMIATRNGVNMDKHSSDSLVRSLTTDLRGVELVLPGVGEIKALRQGKASGRLLGGCLSLVAALLGTDHFPDFTNKIMILEDVNEPLYRIDRKLMQLKMNGIFHKINGLVIGHFLGSDSEDQRLDVENLIMDLTSDFSFPIMSGYPHGHTLPNLTLPIGLKVYMDTGKGSLLVSHDQS